MIHEDKELLLKDLCGRVPYDIKLEVVGTGIRPLMSVNYINRDTIYINSLFKLGEVEIKPYLHPMSSMTEEEFEEYSNLVEHISIGNLHANIANPNSFDWLNAHHFDYRGLIEKGLALAVTKENNPYKE